MPRTDTATGEVSFKITPTEEQKALIDASFEASKTVYELSLEAIAQKESPMSGNALISRLTAWKEGDPKLRVPDSYALQAAAREALRDSKKGKPRLETPHYTALNPKGRHLVRIEGGTIRLPKVGVISAEIPNKIDGAIVRALIEKRGDAYIVTLYLKDQTRPANPDSWQGISIPSSVLAEDPTLRSTMKKHVNAERNLKIARQDLARKEVGSKNYEKQERKIAKILHKMEAQDEYISHALMKAGVIDG